MIRPLSNSISSVHLLPSYTSIAGSILYLVTYGQTPATLDIIINYKDNSYDLLPRSLFPLTSGYNISPSLLFLFGPIAEFRLDFGMGSKMCTFNQTL